MTLGQFALCVDAPKRWVQNAFQALDLPPRYTPELARRLALARAIKRASGTPLRQVFPHAAAVLAAWPTQRTWRLVGPDGAVRVTIDLERFLSAFYTRLSLARCWYAEKRRGRPRKQKRRGVEWAEWYGVDISLLRAQLQLTPEERLRRLDRAVQELGELRVVGA